MTGNLIDSWNDFISYVSYLKTGATSTNTSSCGCMSDKEIENKIKKYISSSESVDANEILKVVYGKNYQSKSEVENMIKQKIDAVIASAPEDLDTLKEIADKIADNKELVPVKLSQLQNDMYFITMDEVETYDSQLRSLIDSKQDAGNYLTEHQSLSEYAKKSELPSAYDDTELANRVEALENAGFLTEHQSLADYATKESVDAADNACAERTQNVISKEENDVVYLRKMISDLAGRLALVEIKQEASSEQVVATSVEEITAIAEPATTSLVLANEETLASMKTSTVYKDIAVVNAYTDTTVKLNASDKVTVEGMTIDGDKDAGNGKINYSTPELEIKNAVVEHTASAYNIFEGEQSTAEGARNTEKILIDNITVDSPELKHNVLNCYTPTDGATITIKNSYFNVNMKTTNIVRVSNYLNSSNVTITFENVDWTYENVPYEQSDIAWSGLVLFQAAKNTADLSLNGDYSKLSTWKIVLKNCRYNSVLVNEDNCKFGNANQVGYFYSDAVKQSVDINTVIPVVFE